MKYILTMLTLLGLATNAEAQSMSANEMLSIVNCDDYECFDDRIREKGYTIKFREEREGANTYDYSSNVIVENKSNPNISMRYKATYTELEGKKIMFNHVLPTEYQYEQLLEEYKKLGFKYVKTGQIVSEHDNSALYYECADYPQLDLTIGVFVKEYNGHEYKEYHFTLSRPIDE